MTDTLQMHIVDCLIERGYGRDYLRESIHDYNLRQYLKAAEEMGEIARALFDGQYPPAEEIADVVIPLYAMADVLGHDLDEVIRRKVEADIARGVR